MQQLTQLLPLTGLRFPLSFLTAMPKKPSTEAESGGAQTGAGADVEQAGA